MKNFKFAAPITAGLLALSLVACGGGASSAASTAASTATSDAASAATSAVDSAAISELEATVEAASQALYWEGTSDKDFDIMYFEDDENSKAGVVITASDLSTAEAFFGDVAVDLEKGEMTITDDESGNTFTMTVTETAADGKSITIDAGDYGVATLAATTEKDLEDQMTLVADMINAQLEEAGIGEEELNEALASLGALAAELAAEE